MPAGQGGATSLLGRDPLTGQLLRVAFAHETIASVVLEPATSQLDTDPTVPWIARGLVDLQVNGFAGHDLNAGDLTIERVVALARSLLGHGVTGFCPTLITAAEVRLCDALATIAAARRQHDWLAAMIPCVHVEGPSISPHDGPRGAHPIEYVRPPDLAEYQRWQRAGDGLVGLVTLSPHWPASSAYIAGLVQHGTRVAIGHTDATTPAIAEAVAAGATLSTHLGNGVAAVLPRHPNLLWQQLADDRLHASFIADGHHLPGDTLTCMLRAKGVANTILVSDTAALGGLPPGRYHQAIGGDVELSEDGRLGLVDSPYLAGAALPLSAGVARVANLPGLALADALAMAIDNPSRFIGRDHGLCRGGRADLIRFHWQPGEQALRMQDVYLGGREASVL